MALSTYANLKDAVAKWLNREDLEIRIPDFISLAIAELNRSLRDRMMVSNTTVVFATNTARMAIPADVLDIEGVENNVLATETLTKEVPEKIARMLRNRLSVAATPLYYCIEGGNLRVCPLPAVTKTYRLTYYKRIDAFTSNGSTNWVLTYMPDLMLYAALKYAWPFLLDTEKSDWVNGGTLSQINAALKANEMAVMEGAEYDMFKAVR